MANKGTLLLAGLAAWAFYKYKKMSPDEKDQITEKIKSTGKKIVESLPDELKNVFGNTEKAAT